MYRAPVLFAFSCLLFLLSPAAADWQKLETDTELRGVYFLPTPDNARIVIHPVIVAGEVDFTGPQGLSHYLEHLMYWHADKLSDAPYHGRSGNAWVNGLITSYFNVGEKAELEDMLRFAGRLLEPPTLDEKFMLDERKVVVREYDFRVIDNPYRRGWQRAQSLLLAGHALSRSVMGTPNSIMSLTLEHARAFHKRYYNPANMVLLITGDLNPASLKVRINKRFSAIKAANGNEQNWRKQRLSGKLSTLLKIQDPQIVESGINRMVLGDWAGVGNRSKDIAVMNLTASVMGSALPGGLGKPLRLNNFVFREFGMWFQSLIEGQIYFSFYGSTDEGVTHVQAGQALIKALAKIARVGVPQKTLDRVRKRHVREMRRKENDNRYMLGFATRDMSNGILPQTMAARIKYIEAVTVKQIDELLSALTMADRQVVIHYSRSED